MNTRFAAALLVVLAVAVGGLSYFYLRNHVPTGSQPPITAPPSQSPSAQTNPAPPTAAPRSTYIYQVVDHGGDSNDLAPKKVELGTKSPARDAMVALIDSPQSPLPAGTRLLDIRLSDGLATVDFSKEFQKNFHGGDLQEAQVINGILMTLGQFPTIDKVQILVEGAAIDSLGGHFDLTGPADVVRPDSQQAMNQ
jgi:germination protein M